MSQFSENIGRKLLRKRAKQLKRDKSVQDFNSANKAVIVFDTQIDSCFPAIKDFSKFLEQQGVKTSIFGYSNQKIIPQEMLLWANFQYITKKDTSWFGKPKGEIGEKYYTQEPDILFVLSFKNHLSVEFMVQLSKAKFKVGCFTEADNDYDLMIKPPKGSCEADFFIEQVKHYIQLLNPS